MKERHTGSRIGPRQDEQAVNEAGRLAALLTVNDRTRLHAEDRHARLLALKARPGYRLLSPEKRARHERRLMSASREALAAADLCEQLQHRLSQLGGRS